MFLNITANVSDSAQTQHAWSRGTKGDSRKHSQNILIQTDEHRVTEDQKEIFQRLGSPETFHAVDLVGDTQSDVVDSGVGDFGAGVLFDGLEDLPCVVLEGDVAGDTVEDEDGFDSFRSVWDVRISECTMFGGDSARCIVRSRVLYRSM